MTDDRPSTLDQLRNNIAGGNGDAVSGLIGSGPFLSAKRSAADETRIPFNRPTIAGRELLYIAQTISFENIAGDGYFTSACSAKIEQRFNIPHVLMVTSCTAALEIAVTLCDLEPGDEVIMP